MKFSRLLFFVLLLLAISLPGKLSAQIYADVTISGAASGTFTITLEHTKAPITVANFIGLATGQRGWLDSQTGAIRHDPFYNGVTFHRILAGFVSQTGSRKGDGSDGPGYAFRDEIDPTLTHATPYTVAMANSGTNTNGSQWYVTQGNQSGLDGGYSIFGVVTSGQAVCAALNAVAADAVSGLPVAPVAISSITVYGPSLAGFNVNPAGLPRVLNGGPVMKVSGASHTLGFDHAAYSQYFCFHSPELTTWSRYFASSYFHSLAPADGDIDVTSLATGSKHFYRLARVDYSSCFTAPEAIAGKTLTFPGLLGTASIKLIIDNTGTGGTYQIDFGGGNPVQSGSITALNYQNNGSAYSSFLYVKLQWNFDIEFSFNPLNFRTANGGKFTGASNVDGFATIAGTFTSSP